MVGAFVYSFAIGSVSATLFFLVDKYERDGMVSDVGTLVIEQRFQFASSRNFRANE